MKAMSHHTIRGTIRRTLAARRRRLAPLPNHGELVPVGPNVRLYLFKPIRAIRPYWWVHLYHFHRTNWRRVAVWSAPPTLARDAVETAARQAITDLLTQEHIACTPSEQSPARSWISPYRPDRDPSPVRRESAGTSARSAAGAGSLW